MSSRPSASLLLILAVVTLPLLGGCNALSSPDARQTATETATPAPVPTASPSWRTANGIDAERLATTHDSALRGQSYTVRTERVVRYANGTLRARTERVGRVSANRSRFAVTVRVRGPYAPILSYEYRNVDVSFFSSGDRLFRRILRNGVATYETTPPDTYDPPEQFFLLPQPGAIDEVFRAVTVQVDVVSTEAGTRYRLTATGMTDSAAFAAARGVTDPHNVSLRATVGADGVVRRYRLRYEATFDGAPIRVVRSGTYEAVGTTTVHRPSWYAAAVNATETTDE